MDIQETVVIFTEFVWLRIRLNYVTFEKSIRVQNKKKKKKRSVFWSAKQLLASKERKCSIEILLSRDRASWQISL
jgi:hypothetical protein